MAEKNNSTNTLLLLLGGGAIAYGIFSYLRPRMAQEYQVPVPPGGVLPGGYVNNTGAPQWAVWTQFGLQIVNQLGQLVQQFPWSSLPGGSANPATGNIDWGSVTEDDINDYLDAYGA